MENLFYTYAYLRENGTPYYIGKGKGKRFSDRTRHRMKVPPKERVLFLKKNLTEEEAFKHEIYMIAIFGRKDLGTGILRNLTNGGEGASGAVRKPESIEKTVAAHKGKKLSPEHRAKIGASQIGRKASAETRAKMSNSLSGEKSPVSFKWRITFDDGQVIIRWGLRNWAKEQGYCAATIGAMAAGKRKRHKNIVAVEKLDDNKVR